MTNLTGNRSVDLFQKLIDWFYVSGQWVLTSLREVNDLEYDFNYKFIRETTFENLKFSFMFYVKRLRKKINIYMIDFFISSSIIIMFNGISHRNQILISLVFAVRSDINQMAKVSQQYPLVGT